MAKSSRPPSKSKPPAAPVPLSTPASEPAPRSPVAAAPVATSAAPVEPIEQQVEALIDQAQQQAQAISDLANSSASGEAIGGATPGHPLSSEGEATSNDSPSAAGGPAVATATATDVGRAADGGGGSPSNSAESPAANSAEATPAAPADQPVDPVALQSQVDAILSEAGYPIDGEAEAATDASESDAAEKPSPDGESRAAPDIAEVDAVIAEAARLALEDDSFGAAEADRGAAARGPDRAELRAADASRPKAIPKGGDVSMRRDKRQRRVQKGADLDGEFPGAASIAPAEAPADVDGGDDDSLEFALPPTEVAAPAGSGWKQRLRRGTLSVLAAANAPWHAWPPITRAAVLALTIGNGLLALVAFAVVLRRLVS
ncbi:MAG: hypothetical protein KJZ69_14785 [Phycisphaerales bacterium]|nr:hypothetical protein [Phycisphaerales bacterium]